MATSASNSPTITTPVLLPLPSPLVAPVTQLQADIAAGLQDAGGLVEQIPPTDAAAINADVLAVEQAAVLLANDPNSGTASAALDAYFNAASIAVIIAEPKSTTRKIVMINPNCFQLASMYLGDYARWQEIAVASGINPPDP